MLGEVTKLTPCTNINIKGVAGRTPTGKTKQACETRTCPRSPGSRSYQAEEKTPARVDRLEFIISFPFTFLLFRESTSILTLDIILILWAVEFAVVTLSWSHIRNVLIVSLRSTNTQTLHEKQLSVIL